MTGVSGSGKSTLVDHILRRTLFRHFYNSKDKPGAHETIRGLEQIDKAVVIDQTPIGRTPRSNPVTYTGAFTPIRELFAQLPAARVRGPGEGQSRGSDSQRETATQRECRPVATPIGAVEESTTTQP